MTSPNSIDVRRVIFVGDAKTSYEAMPTTVRERADTAIQTLQNRGRLPAKRMEGLSGKLAGIDEIKIPSAGDTYRAYLTLSFEAVIYVLDAGIKKSPRGGEIPQWQERRLIERMKKAKEDYTDNKSQYESEMKQRVTRRNILMPTRTPEPK